MGPGAIRTSSIFLWKGKAHHHHREEAAGERHEEPQAGRVAGQDAADQRPEAGPVEDDHRHHRAELHHDLDGLGGLVAVPQQITGDLEVSGRGDGEELGQSFDDAEQEGVEPGHRGAA
jgi:hypothetical protein